VKPAHPRDGPGHTATPAASSWSRCSPSQSCAAAASARESASPSNPGDGSGTGRASRRSRPPAPAWPKPCPDADPPARQGRLPRNAGDSAGTAAPSTPKARPPPSPIAPCAPSGSKHRETSASSGPVATSSGSSIRLPTEAQNRTTRVLPNPDNSCASDRPGHVRATSGEPIAIFAAWRGKTFVSLVSAAPRS
jgi:hypothetical protein